MQRVSNAGQSAGFFRPLQDLAGDAFGRLLDRSQLDWKPPQRIMGGVRPAQAQTARRNLADATPAPGHDVEDLADQALRFGVALATDRARVLILDVTAPLLELPNAHRDALQDVERLEPGHHDGHVVAARERLVLLEAHHGADVARGEKRLDAVGRRSEDGLDGRRHEHVRDEQREVLKTLTGRAVHGHRVRRRRGLEPDREEDDLPRRIRSRDVDGVERRIDHADVGAAGLRREEVGPRSGDAEHVAEGGEDHARPARDLDRRVDQLDRRHAHGTAGAVDERHVGRQELVHAEADDGVGLAAADLHDGPRPRDQPTKRLGVLPRMVRVAVLVQELHEVSSSSSPISRRYSKTRRASRSSTRPIATPTWTRT